MKNFIKEYNDIILKNSYLPKYIGLNMFDILGEWVESPDLVSFPKELQIELCKNLRKQYNNLYIISYRKIVDILKKYNYDYLDDIIENMKKYDALNRSYLILISAKIDDSENLYDNSTLNFIKSNFNDIYDNAYSIFAHIYNNRYADGLTIFHRDEYEPENTYTCVFINRNAESLKDTLEHELTHFIQNVAKYSNKFPKIYSGLTTDKLKNKKIQCADYIKNILIQLNFSNETIYAVKEIIIRAFTDSEEQPTIKSIINCFIRVYEKDKRSYLINHTNKKISQIEGSLDSNKIIEFRLKWINDFLNDINSYKFLNDNKVLIENYFLKIRYEKDYLIENILKYISYLCFKFNYPEYNIDNIIRENFKHFKYRDI